MYNNWYIKFAANTWADKLSRHLNNDDWQHYPSVFHDMDTMFCPHTIDRFASPLYTLLLRYNANSLDPSCEADDGLPTPRRHPMARGKQLVQPPLATTTRLV
jgi:hypothetical protein